MAVAVAEVAVVVVGMLPMEQMVVMERMATKELIAPGIKFANTVFALILLLMEQRI